MKLPELFIFDMDGLLFDTERLFMEFLGRVMARYGYKLTRENYQQTLGLAERDIVNIMKGFYGENYPCEEISDLCRQELNAWAQTHPLPVKPGIPELLKYLKGTGRPCCVASSSPRETISIYLETANLTPYFSHCIGGNEIQHSKPNPEIFLACCRHFQVEPASALVLEDSENGIRAAVNGKIPVICIPDMKRPAQELLEKTCLTAENALEVMDFLKICRG